MDVNKDIVMRVYERLLKKDNLPKGVAEDLQSTIEYIRGDNVDSAYKFALESLKSGAFASCKDEYNKIIPENIPGGGKRKRRQTRAKRAKRHNKSMRGGGKDTHYRTTGSSDGAVWVVLLVIAFAVAMAAQSSTR